MTLKRLKKGKVRVIIIEKYIKNMRKTKKSEINLVKSIIFIELGLNQYQRS